MKAVIAGLCLLLSASAGAEPILGFNYPDWSQNGYAGAGASKDLGELAATGAGWVALTPTLYVKDRRDSVVAATGKTPSDDALRAAIRRARALGLKVVLKPHVDIAAGGARAFIEPKDAAAWFSSYRVFLLKYARIAREENCSLFVVGTELALLTTPNHWKAWRGLIAEVRATYPGPLTYAANWHSVELVGFWRDLDFIGVDAYFPVVGGRNRTVLRLGWLPVEASLAGLSAANGRPILFTEFGLASQKGANLRPWDWTDFGALDLDVQTAYVQTFLDAFSTKTFVAGFLSWSWDSEPSHAGPNDKSMALKGKPALAAFTGLFQAAKLSAAAPPPPAHAPAAARAAAVLAEAPSLGR